MPKEQWSDELFEKYMAGCEENRKAGCGRYHLSKRDIERWGFMPPCGARVEVIELDLSWLPASLKPRVENTVLDLERPTLESLSKIKRDSEMR